MNWKGYLILLAELALVGSMIFATAASRINEYVYFRNAEARIEDASRGQIDVLDIRIDEGNFLIVMHTEKSTTPMPEEDAQKVQEALRDTVEGKASDAYVEIWARPTRDRSEWFMIAIIVCPTGLYLEQDYSQCQAQGGIWQELKSRNVRWRNQ